jgi:hypothetical protein
MQIVGTSFEKKLLQLIHIRFIYLLLKLNNVHKVEETMH